MMVSPRWSGVLIVPDKKLGFRLEGWGAKLIESRRHDHAKDSA
jgi:hypothetical protein